MTTAVDIRDVTKIYSPDSSQAVTALENISLTINDNEFFTLLGPSGCGKTTLLRLIAGFEQVSGGEIMLFDKEIENLEPNRRSVNTVFQHYALFPHMTVADNVAFGLERLKKPKAEIKATVERVLTDRRFGSRFSISLPNSMISPPETCSKPAIRRNKVVFPQPEGPSNVKNSLSLIVSEMFSSAVTA